MSLLLAVGVALLTGLLAEELIGWTKHAARRVVLASAARLPAELRERYREEWLGELSAIEGRPIWGLIWAIAEPARGSLRLRKELRQGAGAQVSTAVLNLPPDTLLPRCVVEVGHPLSVELEGNLRVFVDMLDRLSRDGQALVLGAGYLVLVNVTIREVHDVFAEFAQLSWHRAGDYNGSTLCSIRLSRRVHKRLAESRSARAVA